ncbi:MULTISPECIES: GNAT family N-acetyltransferase [Sphingobacterium]|uniref:GNAT family N-acetyltransferase n=1 Tax=Sphingobacterium TaxID=28453 RepID=UPI001043D6FB|nr:MULTISPECIES: GNAT family N-acetyltransferase [Sphingobacterium]MCS3556269.1 GNAT superfamily N-acetyltransferase [Sphingobacterium sp. JUb21]MCW2260004.1 GNAT superfamily N-acetyltransferase [Sphingobacterium kitahiroshimense]NJI72049.1 GNAT family N-acetyltransferase [Sphingobacterium sp. B16(2022)]TCR08639.1 ribosomal protein S18 acetylase RimI-like enzyme [Sphingobacterium sp. JUb20]TCR11202.1 ribosomal protein S18 acetylase RimI-like enzyme [Sphingobacterium sp. JUb78]
MDIRKATPADLPQIKILYSLLFEQLANYEPDYLQPALQDEAFLQQVVAAADNFVAFIYTIDGEAKGFAIAKLEESPPYNCFVPLKCMYLMDIVVDQNMRGKGIGKALIDRIKQWAKEQEADYLELSVLAKNTLAEALYLREGFETFSKSMRMKIK